MAKIHYPVEAKERRKLTAVVVLTLFVFAYGTVGYMIVEGWDFLDSLYMTIITISTVGYGETRPLDPVGRVFTISLLFFGVGTFLYLAGSVIQVMVEGRLRRILGRVRVEKKLAKLSGHTIVCGYGRIGRALCRTLVDRGQEVVAIEQSSERAQTMRDDGILYMLGKATDEAKLLKAGVERAAGLATVVGDDSDNVFLVLSAKQLNPNLHVVSRANRTDTIKTLKAAGADQVVSPFLIGGHRIANAILRPTVMSFLDQAIGGESTTDIHIEEVLVASGSALIGQSLAASPLRGQLDLLVIAIQKAAGQMEFNPSASATIHEGDTVIAVGRYKDLCRLQEIAQPGGQCTQP